MRALIAFAALCCAVSAAHAETRSWNFRVWLDDRESGRHRFTLEGSGEQSELRSEARFDVLLLFIDAYRYRHEAIEHWNRNCLQSLASRTDANGERLAVSAVADGSRLVVTRAAGRSEHEGCVMSFAYWNPQILTANRLLNSQTGELLPVTVTPQGATTVVVRGEPRTAQHYRISAPGMPIDVWYVDANWVALEAPAGHGRRLRYELI
jgi:Family of unknown function (DUF6134)